MPLSLFRLFVVALATMMSTHASATCRYAVHAPANAGERVLASLRETVRLAPASSDAYEPEAAAGAQVKLASQADNAADARVGYVVGVVTRGRFMLREDGRPPRMLGLGETFFEPADAPGLRLDSATSNASARVVGVYLPKALAPHRPRHERS